MVQADLQQYRVLLHLNKIISSPLRSHTSPVPPLTALCTSWNRGSDNSSKSHPVRVVTHNAVPRHISVPFSFSKNLHGKPHPDIFHFPSHICQNNNKKPTPVSSLFYTLTSQNWRALDLLTSASQGTWQLWKGLTSAPKQLINHGETARGQWMSLLLSYCHSHCRNT